MDKQFCIYCNAVTNTSILYCNSTCVREDMDKIASGGWEYYSVLSERICIATSFVK
jgi:hypothetical protein